jgi:hypothetical protein
VDAVFAALTGRPWQDPGDHSPHPEPDIRPRLAAVRQFHGW